MGCLKNKPTHQLSETGVEESVFDSALGLGKSFVHMHWLLPLDKTKVTSQENKKEI